MSQAAEISAQALSDTIGAIYDCALDPQRWQHTVARVIELSESAAGGMCIHDMRTLQNSRVFNFGYQPGFDEQFERAYPNSPMAAAVPLADVGDVIPIFEAEPALLESRFYKEVIAPYGYLDYLGLVALRTDGRIASLHTCRNEADPRYGDREIGIFKLLSPHICRALAISDALDLRTLQAEMLEATLDGLAAGVYLTARDGRVVYMNKAAERQVKTGNALRIVSNRLYPTEAKTRAALAKAIEDISKDETDAGPGGHSMAIAGTDGTGYVATLLPLARGRRQSITAPFAASVAVFVQDPIEIPFMPGEAFARLYRLTGGELRVLLALSQGLGGTQAAEMLGIAATTVKTHLENIFAKTGTSKQAELLRLLQSSAPPVRTGA